MAGRPIAQSNPATGEALESVTSHSASDLPNVVARARTAQQRAWGSLTFKERASYINKIGSYLADHADEGACIVSANNGKTRQDALVTEILSGILACQWYADNTATVLEKKSLPNGSILFTNKANYLEYSPIGVVGIISPWNYPFSIPFGEVIMGLMAGNAIILKVATQTLLVGKFIERCIEAAGLPAGIFTHMVVGGAEAGPGLLAAGVNKLFFTGSIAVGKSLMVDAAKTLTPLSLELGGKDPMIVLEDASIERAVNGALWGGFQNAGQSCGGIERIYVAANIYNVFLSQLVAKTKQLRHGPDTGNFNVDIGSMTTKSQMQTVASQVEEAVAQGAQIAAQSYPVGDVSRGFFYPATVLINVNHNMRIMREENFGPVLPVMKFNSLEEGIALANDCTMGLTSSIWGSDHNATQRLASRLQSGVVSINDHLMSHGISETPWGGWKESGLGRTHGHLGLHEMSNVRCVTYERVPSCLIPRNMFWHPFDRDSYEGLLTTVKFASGSFWQRLTTAGSVASFGLGRMLYDWTPNNAQGGRERNYPDNSSHL